MGRSLPGWSASCCKKSWQPSERRCFNHQIETETRLRLWLADRTYTVLLACEDMTAVGFLALTENHALYAEGAFGAIPELYVRPAFRSRQVGATLLAEAKRIARSKGWTRLEVTTPPLPQFDRTLAFYERQGFSISGGRKMKVDLK
ncbi:MAG: GNAT family N-acetyltransferase [Nitrospirota bacterium]|nr:GNAT family N-acetyltransferase [Nitrospirota bacterium]